MGQRVKVLCYACPDPGSQIPVTLTGKGKFEGIKGNFNVAAGRLRFGCQMPICPNQPLLATNILPEIIFQAGSQKLYPGWLMAQQGLNDQVTTHSTTLRSRHAFILKAVAAAVRLNLIFKLFLQVDDVFRRVKMITVINVSLLTSHQGDPGSIPGRATPDSRMWESCRTMPLVGGPSRGSPVSPGTPLRRCFIHTSITLIGSQDLDVKSRPNLFTLNFEKNNARAVAVPFEPETSWLLDHKDTGQILPLKSNRKITH
ncbi:hypothetical protein PR048_025916 [Dryococelus australis]|uniref:Uncharacterized protein n=1 Tax=Dryococelus australis TaxID=614101 RepID=A0ABQ9GJW7_9NEOP|nr:hypothetical protein PR048_025916 [Dryococelus australis]